MTPAGFPNGRRLTDDVVDIELRVIAGALLPADQGGKQIPLGDGVDANDKPFRATFPYVALPTLGFDSPSSGRSRPTRRCPSRRPDDDHGPGPGDRGAHRRSRP